MPCSARRTAPLDVCAQHMAAEAKLRRQQWQQDEQDKRLLTRYENAWAIDTLTVGTHVHHQKYGDGLLLDVSSGPSGLEGVVRFSDGTQRRFALRRSAAWGRAKGWR